MAERRCTITGPHGAKVELVVSDDHVEAPEPRPTVFMVIPSDQARLLAGTLDPARDAVIRRLLGEWEPVLPGDALAEYVDGEVYDDDAPAPCWVQFDTYDERAEKPSEPMTDDEVAVVRAAREAEARG